MSLLPKLNVEVIATGTEGANLNDSMSQANQGHLIEVLEQAIGDARNNKYVISLMKEVELKEKAAEQANVEAAMAGSNVLAKMHNALEVRLAEAENEIKSAEQCKVEKEKAVMETLADEELIMEKVMQEAMMLKQQARR